MHSSCHFMMSKVETPSRPLDRPRHARPGLGIMASHPPQPASTVGVDLEPHDPGRSRGDWNASRRPGRTCPELPLTTRSPCSPARSATGSSPLPRRSDPCAATGLAGDRRGRELALDLADGDGQDPRGIPRDPRPALSRARGRDALAGLRCVYVSPLRSLGYDIERNLSEPLEAIRRGLGLPASPVTVGVRTGDTSAYAAAKLARRAASPADHDSGEPFALAQPAGLARALAWPAAPHRRRGPRAGADQARGRPGGLARTACRPAPRRDPCRIGLSATCRPAEPVARFLVGPGPALPVIEAPTPPGRRPWRSRSSRSSGPTRRRTAA